MASTSEASEGSNFTTGLLAHDLFLTDSERADGKRSRNESLRGFRETRRD